MMWHCLLRRTTLSANDVHREHFFDVQMWSMVNVAYSCASTGISSGNARRTKSAAIMCGRNG